MKLEMLVSEKLGKAISDSSNQEIYQALMAVVQDMAEQKESNAGKKKVYYVSAEFLIGKLLSNNMINLGIYKEVKEILENAGYTVSMTRTGDTLPSLVERPTQANAENAAVFVSIHINSVDNAPNANGTEVYYADSNNGNAYGTTSEKLATNILNRMLYYMGSTNRGVKTAEHAVTKRCEMPAALTEVGFITNPTEVYNMTTDEYQYKAAQGIAEGIMITLKDINVPQ